MHTTQVARHCSVRGVRLGLLFWVGAEGLACRARQMFRLGKVGRPRVGCSRARAAGRTHRRTRARTHRQRPVGDRERADHPHEAEGLSSRRGVSSWACVAPMSPKCAWGGGVVSVSPCVRAPPPSPACMLMHSYTHPSSCLAPTGPEAAAHYPPLPPPPPTHWLVSTERRAAWGGAVQIQTTRERLARRIGHQIEWSG
jgi:hypothetical protein